MPSCPRCNAVMTSGEECRLFETVRRCFACWPHDAHSLLNFLAGEMSESEFDQCLALVDDYD